MITKSGFRVFGRCPMRPHDHAEAQVSGLLADRAPGFAAYLAGRGYAKSSVEHHLYLMADLSAWLAGQGLDSGDLAGPAAGRFWEDLRARGSYLVKGTSLKPILDYLRGIGVLPEQAGGPASAAGALLHEYDRYLRAERGAGEVTIAHYLRYAHEFLAAAGWPQDGPEFGAGLAALDGAQVLDIVSRQVARHRLPSVGAALTGDRAFLRFLERTERSARPLATAVPRAARQPSRLPGQVDPAMAAAIMASCDRSAEGGCRDRAVLLLLHRYGLRPVEVTRLELPDLRWRTGEFVVHGKAGRVDVLPLLRDVGEAIVEYLRIRRPAPPGVTAVFLAARAPVQPMRKSSVGAHPGDGEEPGELDLASAGNAVGGLALAALGLAGPDRDAGAVGLHIQHVRDRGRRRQRHDLAGTQRGGLSQSGRPRGGAAGLGGPLDGLGAHGDPGQVLYQRGGLAERDLRAAPGDHLGQARRGRRAGHAQPLVKRREPVPALPAVIPGPHHPDRAEHGGDGLGPAAGVAGLVTVPAPGVRAGIPVVIAGQHSLQQPDAGRHQRGAHRLLQHAESGALAQHRSGEPGQLAYLRGGDLLDLRREPPLSPPA